MIVIDTSVAIKWLRSDEELFEEAITVYKNHIDRKEEIIIPSLLYIEAANALATNNILSSKDVSEGMEFLYAAELHEHIVTKSETIEASVLAKRYKTTVYDMLYAVVAKKRQADLITSDNRFVDKVNFSFVKNLS